MNSREQTETRTISNPVYNFKIMAPIIDIIENSTMNNKQNKLCPA